VPAAPERRRGCGCWIPLILAVLLALALVGVGLFLPPINLYDRLFGAQYAMLDAANNAIAADGLTLVLSPDDPGREFGVALESTPLQTFIAPPAGEEAAWIAPVRAALPPYVALQSPVYSVQTTGSAPQNLTLALDAPGNVPNLDLIDLYAYDGTLWRFVPSQPTVDGKISATVNTVPRYVALVQASPLDPVVHTTIEIDEALNSDAGLVATIVSPAGLTPNLEGALVGSLAPGFTTSAGYRVMPVIRNFEDPRAVDPQTVPAILNNDAVREAHAMQIAAIAINSGFGGVVIDYRDLPVESRELYTRFLQGLKNNLRASGLSLAVVLPAAENVDGSWQTGAYDWRAIGESADYVIINFRPNPADFAAGEDRLIEAMLRWAVGEVSRYKLVAGLSALSLREQGGDFTAVTFDQALAQLGNVQIDAVRNASGIVEPGEVISASLDGPEAVPGLDRDAQTPYIDYMAADGSVASRVWLTTAGALRYRMDRMGQFLIGGVSLSDLSASGVGDDLFAAIFDYKLLRPSDARDPELGLRWRVEDASGVVSEVTTGLSEPLVVTLEAVQGNFAINVEVVDGGESAAVRSGAAVAVFQPTPTPTPLPTSTPTPPPTATPTLEVIVPTSAGNPGVGAANNPPPVNPAPGRIAGGFEYGGHVTSTSSEVAANAMRRSGMTWMKVQVRYGVGSDPGAVAGVISEGKARGFKVMLGVVGNPGDLAAGGGSYIQQFADYLGGLAAAGADAIEVWNEPNIDREWPAGQISGANYTAMLGVAYQAIKSRNSSTIVISGAPAPTGAEAAFPGRVVNDDRFLREMVEAGAVNYMDCVGVHYNEGVVSPTQVSGDPRDNFYSRYYQSMVDLYWNATGGQRPLCFTELGYLSPEGFGFIPDFFAWGAGTTVAEQAAWLAEAIALASNSGRVRILIVWNVDFSRYDANDPQAGFAMVRPGGACPACDAIAGAR
jgi:spore germination protein YaaH